MATEEKKFSPQPSLEEHIAEIIDQEIFYPPNLTEDEQLRNNIDSNGYMPLTFITGNRHIKSLTSDEDCIIKGIQLCKSIQMSEDGRRIKVDLQPKRNTLILRNQPDNATQKDIEHIFDDPNCAKFRELRPDISNTWFVTFDTEEECSRTVTYLQTEKKLAVGMKTSVNPLAEIAEKQAHQAAASPRGGAGVPTSAPVDILSSATISPGNTASQVEYFTPPNQVPFEDSDLMSHYRNPYAPFKNFYMNDPVMNTHPPSPPMGALGRMPPQSPPATVFQPMDLPREPMSGDYMDTFKLYQRSTMMEIYQKMLTEGTIIRPDSMNIDLPCVIDERLESTMVQQPKNPPRKPREQNRANRRRQSPRGRNNRDRGRDSRDPRDMPPYDDRGYPPPPPPAHSRDDFFDDFGPAVSPGYYSYDDHDDLEPFQVEEPPERRNRPRNGGGGGQRRRKGRNGRGRGQGGRSTRNPKSRNRNARKEYRPVNNSEEKSNDVRVNGTTGSPRKGNGPSRSSVNSRRGSRRGKQKFVYRPKESS